MGQAAKASERVTYEVLPIVAYPYPFRFVHPFPKALDRVNRCSEGLRSSEQLDTSGTKFQFILMDRAWSPPKEKNRESSEVWIAQACAWVGGPAP